MTKEESMEFEGIVTESLPNTNFKVRLDNVKLDNNEILTNYMVTAHASGKIKKNRIKIVVNDKVIVQMTHYDLTKARIIQRVKHDNKI